MNLVYKNEKPLFAVLFSISALVWLALIVGTLGLALVYLLFFFIFYVFAHSAFISYLKGTGVRISATQFPDLHEKIQACCQKLGMEKAPDAYVLHAGGAFNALATRFLGRNFIVLYADIVDALEEHPDALNFYIGHEIGHLKRNHLLWAPVLMPAAFLPLAGAAYARAREYTCDRHGFAACADPVSAQYGLAALAAGGKRWRTMNKEGYVSQAKVSSGFWMSLHELVSDYPWLTKRMAAIAALATGQNVEQPRRNLFAWILALFIPRVGGGAGAGGVLVIAAIIGVLAAVALPAYQEYMARQQLTEAVSYGQNAVAVATQFYDDNEVLPENLNEVGFSNEGAPAGVKDVNINPGNGEIALTVDVPLHSGKTIVFTPELDENEKLVWHCSTAIPQKVLPEGCQTTDTSMPLPW